MSSFTVTVQYGGCKLEVHGDASRHRPAVTNPDSPHFGPAEGGIEEISAVYLLDDKGKRVELPYFLQEYLDGQSSGFDPSELNDSIEEALKECAEAGKADREERE